MIPTKFTKESLVFCIVLIKLINFCSSSEEYPQPTGPTCFSDIYCHGPLLRTVQMARIYEDSKTFVDMKLKRPPNETLERFDVFMKKWNQTPSKFNVMDFVNENFEKEGTEFEHWDPSDWRSDPSFVNSIKDDELKEWGLQLNDIWKSLGRKMKSEVEHNQELYSIIWVPHPVIVPGGRFREFYYWDSYWIVQGLLLSEMHHTVKGMLENFLYIVDHYGHIPNGGRVYYLARSQPPLLIPMIKSYYEYTHDLNFIKDNIDIMEKEFEYWLREHCRTIKFDGNEYTMALYGDKSYGPRPESFSEDVESAKIFQTDEKKREAFYSELKAGAESGWDFSSRWFITDATNKGNLTNIKTRSIIPVDLNAFMYWNAVLLAEFNGLLGNSDKVIHYTNQANEWLKAVDAVLWHEEIGSWLDYDLINNVKRDYFYPTNIAPLWTGCYNATNKVDIAKRVRKYLENKNIKYPGGVPSTHEHTGEQWDYPNAWPPLQHMMIVGLNNTGDEHLVRLAFEIADTWIRSNHKAYKDTNNMFEKYDATVFGGHGGGGEYEVQFGFGWTNGVIMDLLWRYGSQLKAEIPEPPEVREAVVSSSSITSITTALIALLVSLTAGFIGRKYSIIWLWKTNSMVTIDFMKETKRNLLPDTSEGKNFSKG